MCKAIANTVKRHAALPAQQSISALRASLLPSQLSHLNLYNKEAAVTSFPDAAAVSTCLLLKLMEFLPSGKSCRFPHGSVQRSFSASAYVPYRPSCCILQHRQLQVQRLGNHI